MSVYADLSGLRQDAANSFSKSPSNAYEKCTTNQKQDKYAYALVHFFWFLAFIFWLQSCIIQALTKKTRENNMASNLKNLLPIGGNWLLEVIEEDSVSLEPYLHNGEGQLRENDNEFKLPNVIGILPIRNEIGRAHV